MVLPRLPKTGLPAPVQGTPLQIAETGVGAPGPPGSPPTLESEDKIPAGVIIEVVGCSADTEKALPHGPASAQRSGGMRRAPVEATAPPSSIESVAAASSEKL